MENLVKDFEMNSSLEKVLSFCVFMSLFFLAVGALTSISILSLSHVFIILPALYFIPKANYKNYPKSAWALLAFAIVLVLSVVVNQDIIANGYKNISKTKYFFIGFLSIAPLNWYFRKHLTAKKISILLYAFVIVATISTISGIIGKFTGMNPITGKPPFVLDRNSGMMGMVMNYAHNMVFFLLVLLSLLLNKEKTRKYINYNFLIGAFFINLIGFYFSYTRGAWLGFLVAIPFLFIKKPRLFIGIIFLGLIGGYTMYSIAGRSVQRSSSEEQRIDLWKASLHAFKSRPILGYGYLNFEPHSVAIKTKLNLPTATHIKGQSHSNFFEILATGGIVGVVILLFWKFLWCIELLKRKDTLAILGVALWVAFLIGGLTQSTIALGINLFVIIACYSLLVFKKREV